MDIFIATAFRWGWTNAHTYTVHVGLDEAAADDAAEEECESRGGKYGVEVLKFTTPDDCERVSYYPSTYGEKEPHANYRIDAFERFGNWLGAAIEDDNSTAMLPATDDPRRLVPTKVEIPQWIRSQYEHDLEIAKVLAPPPKPTNHT